MARTCECEHPQSQHKLSKGGCRALDCYCSKFVSGYKPEPDPEPQPVDEAARAGQTTADIEASGHLPVIEIQPADPTQLDTTGWVDKTVDSILAEPTSAALRRVEQERDQAKALRFKAEAAAGRLVDERDLARAELATARTAYLAQSAELTSARTELEQVKRDWDSMAVELASVKDAATRKVTALLEAHAPAEPPLWQYTVWFCQPATGCGQRYSQDQPDHECGPLTAAVVTITRQPEEPS
jgi:hypothetical protein